MPARLAALFVVLLATPSFGGDKVQYNRDVRPIFAETCFACHGPDSAARKGKLRLDQREAAIERGAIDPKNLTESEMLYRLTLADDDESRMPPPSSHKNLTAAQKDTLKRWVTEGAEYQQHWAFLAPTRPTIPKVGDANWVKTPIDAFILAELKKQGLKPNAEADRRTLARRAAFDIIGLPPTPEEVEQFVKDSSPNAYENYLDRLFASPHYGEHRGRYWLDAARYADTHGIHFDNYREVWAYRDWVINAYNQNMKFDQFTLEQLAGDLLPNPTIDQLVATGFNRNNITTNEGGAISEEYLVLYTRERTDAAATVFMGLTAGCAVCHDHKFDPISQKEFYSLAAYFNNSTQKAMDGNVKDTPPIVFVPATEDRTAWDTLKTRIRVADKAVDAKRATGKSRFETWLKWRPRSDALLNLCTPDHLVFHAPMDTPKVAMAGQPVELKLPEIEKSVLSPIGVKVPLFKPAPEGVTVAGVGEFDADQPFSAATWFQVPNRGQHAGIIAKMRSSQGNRGWDIWLENDRLAVHLVHDWPRDAIKVVMQTSVNVNQFHHVAMTYDGSRTPGGIKLYLDGELQPTQSVANDKLVGTIKTDALLTLGSRTGGQGFRSIAMADVRVAEGVWGGQQVNQLALAGKAAGILSKSAKKRSATETDELFAAYLACSDSGYRDAYAALSELRSEEVGFRSRGTVAAVMHEKPTPAEAFVLFRGEYDQRRDKVTPGTPNALPAMDKDAPANRLGLAQWLLRPDHPLTARVTVNRLWQQLFGTGLVRTAGDFGVTGEPPTHPELLDWLAVEFRTGESKIAGLDAKSAWDVKRMMKLMMMSSAYRQSAVCDTQKAEADPSNRYLARGPRFRMDAEVIRDTALSAAGLLTPKVGGASVRPYQPGGVWEAVAMKESNTSRYQADRGENLYRRSLYTFWKRAAPPASMEIFNAPNRETCTVRRERTNTPLQALVTLNDPQFVEAARVLAQATLAAETSDANRLGRISARLMAREFTPTETRVIVESLAGLRAYYTEHTAEAQKLVGVGATPSGEKLPAVELAAWTMLCNELMNLDEVLCK